MLYSDYIQSKRYGPSPDGMLNAYDLHYGVDPTDYSSDQDVVFFLSSSDYDLYLLSNIRGVLKRPENDETLSGKYFVNNEMLLGEGCLLDKVFRLIPLDRSAESLLVYDNGDAKLNRIFQGQSWQHLKKNEPVRLWKQPGTGELLSLDTEITDIKAKITVSDARLQIVEQGVSKNDGKLDAYSVLFSCLTLVIVAIINGNRRERALEKRVEKLAQRIEKRSQKTKRSNKKSNKKSKR